ncbi:SH3 domain-containing protein, partial [Rhizobium ruizarguesonis]
AEMMATTVNDLNVRAGPGPQYPTVVLATRGSTAVLDGCIEGSLWCRVDVNGMRGWVYTDYLQVDQGGTSAPTTTSPPS